MGASIKDVHTPGGGGLPKVYKGGGVVFKLCTYTIFEDAQHKSVLLFWKRNVPTSPTYAKKECKCYEKIKKKTVIAERAKIEF